jgi:hypothetical protein
MANITYTPAKKKFLDGDIDMLTDTIRAVLLKSSYTPVATDEFLSAIAGSNRVGTPQDLTGKSTTGGVFDAGDPTFPSVGATTACDKILIYKFVTGDADSPLITSLDLASALTPDGNNILITWSEAAGKIFRLV